MDTRRRPLLSKAQLGTQAWALCAALPLYPAPAQLESGLLRAPPLPFSVTLLGPDLGGWPPSSSHATARLHAPGQSGAGMGRMTSAPPPTLETGSRTRAR